MRYFRLHDRFLAGLAAAKVVPADGRLYNPAAQESAIAGGQLCQSRRQLSVTGELRDGFCAPF
jgi:hypothetical protein